MKIIFLDDERNPEDVTWIDYPYNVDWIIVRNKYDFIQAFCDHVFHSNEKFGISFDHDIQELDKDGTEVTGYSILKEVLDHYMTSSLTIPEPIMYFHTKNPVGLENMEKYYQNFLTVYRSL